MDDTIVGVFFYRILMGLLLSGRLQLVRRTSKELAQM